MKNYKKLGIALMVVAVLVTGLVLASCKNVYEGDSSSYSSAGTKTVTVTLKKKTYKVEYDGKTAEGDHTSAEAASIKVYTGTSSPDYFYAWTSDNDKTLVDFGFAKGGMSNPEWYVTISGTLSKKAVDGDGNPIDVELIILDE